jgi:hypothetical protein
MDDHSGQLELDLEFPSPADPDHSDQLGLPLEAGRPDDRRPISSDDDPGQADPPTSRPEGGQDT